LQVDGPLCGRVRRGVEPSEISRPKIRTTWFSPCGLISPSLAIWPSAMRFAHSTLSPFARRDIITALRYVRGVIADEITTYKNRTRWPRMRVGIGQDRHRLKSGGPLKLGGVEVPHDQQAVAHSDGDVLLHAVTDAILGAAALGDIGEMFPDSDEANRDRDSVEMLAAALTRVHDAGYRISNIDCIIMAQRPKLSPFRQQIQSRIADVLQVDPSQVGIKAKTGENLGPVGREEAIEATCVALLDKNDL